MQWNTHIFYLYRALTKGRGSFNMIWMSHTEEDFTLTKVCMQAWCLREGSEHLLNLFDIRMFGSREDDHVTNKYYVVDWITQFPKSFDFAFNFSIVKQCS